jgi:hypothetical protein
MRAVLVVVEAVKVVAMGTQGRHTCHSGLLIGTPLGKHPQVLSMAAQQAEVAFFRILVAFGLDFKRALMSYNGPGCSAASRGLLHFIVQLKP